MVDIHSNATHQMHGNPRFLPWHRAASLEGIQASNPGQDPPLVGAAAVMDPWPETETDTRDTVSLGYAYV